MSSAVQELNYIVRLEDQHDRIWLFSEWLSTNLVRAGYGYNVDAREVVLREFSHKTRELEKLDEERMKHMLLSECIKPQLIPLWTPTDRGKECRVELEFIKPRR